MSFMILLRHTTRDGVPLLDAKGAPMTWPSAAAARRWMNANALAQPRDADTAPVIVPVRDRTLCAHCRTQALVPGVLFPMPSDERDDHAYVERCDECALFVDDVSAATAVSALLGPRHPVAWDTVGVDGWYSGHPYIAGLTFRQAERIGRRRPKGLLRPRGRK